MKINIGLEPEWFDTGEAQYFCSPITTSERMNFMTQAAEEFGTASIALLRLKMSDWKGVEDEDGNEVSFKPEHIDWLPVSEVTALARMLHKASKLTEDDRKN